MSKKTIEKPNKYPFDEKSYNMRTKWEKANMDRIKNGMYLEVKDKFIKAKEAYDRMYCNARILEKILHEGFKKRRRGKP